MTHVDEGRLRRAHDEADILNDHDRAHLELCGECRERMALVASTASAAAGWLEASPLPVDAEAALAHVRRTLAATPAQSNAGLRRRLIAYLDRPRHVSRPLAATAVLAVIASIFGLMVVSGTAQSMLEIFQPKKFVAVQVSPVSLGALPDLSKWGTMGVVKQPAFGVAHDQAAAADATKLALLVPKTLPRSVTGGGTWSTMTDGTATFTFSKEKARQAVAASGGTLPAMPGNLDGTVLTLTAGPAAIETFGRQPLPSELASPDPSNTRGAGPFAGMSIPQLAIVQMKTPQLTTSGASLKDLEEVLFAMPGFPPDLAAQLRAIDDPTHTLPIPIPTGRANTPGLLVGDNTGLGSAVIWEKDGKVYAVAGTLTQDEVMAVANSLG
jgi:hypothetical protein